MGDAKDRGQKEAYERGPMEGRPWEATPTGEGDASDKPGSPTPEHEEKKQANENRQEECCAICPAATALCSALCFQNDLCFLL